MRRAIFFFWAVASGCGDKDSSGSLDGDGDGVALGADCDDDDALVHPGAEEHCNGIDDDCDGPVDEDAVDAIAVFTDADGDGFGGAEAGTACTPPGDESAVGGDCDDQDPARHPDALEICNGGIDDDCDGEADDADDDVARTTSYYTDLDGDGFGGGVPVQSCKPVPDRLDDGTDCDDGDPSVHPGAPELCDDVDDDCDAATTDAGVVSVAGVPYTEIQQAVDAAPVGGVVAICEGTWYENVVVNNDVVLEGRAAELSIIDGNEWGSVVSVGTDGMDLTVRRLTLQHGRGEIVSNWDTYFSGLAGGGVEASRARALTIEESVIADNTADMGGGVMGPYVGGTVIEDTVLRGNDAADTGGGAAFWNTDAYTIEISGSEITDNSAGCDGGGITFEGYYHSPPFATLTDTLIDGNVGSTSSSPDCAGGGIFSAAYLTLTGVTISNNVSDRGGGAYLVWCTALADDDTVVSGNSTSGNFGQGGGIAVEYAAWSYGTFEDNTASFGGGVALIESELHDATVQDNHATLSGGGVWMHDTFAEVYDSTISSNTSDDVGGGIGTGTSTRCNPGSCFALLSNVVIQNNTAKVAGGGARVELDFESDACDWGAGVTENSPDDVSLYSEEAEEEVTYDEFSAPEDFVCTVSDLVCE